MTDLTTARRVAVDHAPASAVLRHPVTQVAMPLLALAAVLAIWPSASTPADAVGMALPWGHVVPVICGGVLLAAAPITATRHPAASLPWAHIAVGVPALLWGLTGATAATLALIGMAGQHALTPVMLWGSVTAPGNRPASRTGVGVIAGGVVAALLATVGGASGGQAQTVLAWLATVVAAAALAVMAVLLRRRWRGTPLQSMTAFLPAFFVAPVWVAVWLLALHTAPSPQSTPVAVHLVATTMLQVIVIGAAVILVRVVLEMVVRGVQAAGLVVEVQAAPLDRLEDTLRRALRDPSLRLELADDSGALRTVDGETAVAIDPNDHTRARSPLVRDGRLLGAVVHSRGLQDDAEVLRAVLAAVALTLDNQRLMAEASARLAEAHASRGRIVSAADEARRRVERDLHDGAQARLVAATMELRTLDAVRGNDPEIAAVLAELDAALVDLRELARGLYPAALDEGIATALRALADRSPVRVRLGAVPDDRYDVAIEQCVYFLVSEALQNAAKHAQATAVDVRVDVRSNALDVVVSDDGIGGADPTGGGLVGVADRVGALNGTLDIASPRGGGTKITATLPARPLRP